MIKMSEIETQLPATVELSTAPEVATNDALRAVTYLMELLDKKPKKVMIHGKRHIEFDDWIILGNFYGIDVKTKDAEPIDVFGVKGAKAKADVVRIDDGRIIGGAEAYCLYDEPNWIGKPFFQLASMAQTRAGSKALANVLRGFVALKGISGTPAEEMINQTQTNGNGKPATRRPATKARTNPDDIIQDEVNDIVNETVKKPAKRTTRTVTKAPKGHEDAVDAEITETKGKNPTGKTREQKLEDNLKESEEVPLYKRCSGLHTEFDQLCESTTNKDVLTSAKLKELAKKFKDNGSMTTEEHSDIMEQIKIWG
jgi:hypothetical protein